MWRCEWCGTEINEKHTCACGRQVEPGTPCGFCGKNRPKIHDVACVAGSFRSRCKRLSRGEKWVMRRVKMVEHSDSGRPMLNFQPAFDYVKHRDRKPE
jgi:hypothetical protein